METVYSFLREWGAGEGIIHLAEALEYGLVGVNDTTGYTHEMPFGGCEESGLGRAGGQEGLEEDLESKFLRNLGITCMCA